MKRYNDAEVVDLAGYIQELEAVIVAKDRRISELEDEVSVMKKAVGGIGKDFSRDRVVCSEKHSSARQDCEGQIKIKDAGSPNQVSDESCEVESDGSFSNTEDLNSECNLNVEGTEENIDGRWNIPFDDLSEDGLVIKNDTALNEYVLRDMDFVAIQDRDQLSLAHRSSFQRSNVSPVRPLAMYPVRYSVSPIIQAVRRGLVKDSILDKENVHPAGVGGIKPTFSSGFTSPCR